jgi:hypothetical protein
MPDTSPQRSCLGCRQVKDKGELLRFVLAPDRTVVPDILSRLPGRGAYTCCRRSCLAEAVRRNQFARSFKGAVISGAAQDIQSAVTARFEERIASYVALANKAGKTVSGSDMVEDAVRGQTAGLVIIAGDVSTEIAGRLERLAARSGTPCYRILSRERLGDLLGKGLRSAVGILPGGFVKSMLYELDRFRNFVEEGAHE